MHPPISAVIAAPSLSVVTYMELVQGMRNKRGLQAPRKAFAKWEAKIIYINELRDMISARFS